MSLRHCSLSQLKCKIVQGLTHTVAAPQRRGVLHAVEALLRPVDGLHPLPFAYCLAVIDVPGTNHPLARAVSGYLDHLAESKRYREMARECRGPTYRAQAVELDQIADQFAEVPLFVG